MGAVTAALADLAGVVRRAREGLGPRIRTYDERGRARSLDPAAPDGQALLEAAESLLDVSRARPPKRAPSADSPA